MKRSVRLRLVCLCVAAAVLSSALLVAAATGSPYEVLKKSAIATMRVENATMNTRAELYVDGERVGGGTEEQLSKIANGALWTAYGDVTDYYRYRDQEFSISGYGKDYLGESFYVNRVNNYGSISAPALFDFNPDERELRLAELVADMVTGDLKNNIAMGRDGELRTLYGTMTENQLPELYDLLLDMAAADMVNYYGSYMIEDAKLLSYDLEAMTVDLRNSHIRDNRGIHYSYSSLHPSGYPSIDHLQDADYLLTRDSFQARLLTEDDPLFDECTGGGMFNTVLIEGLTYGFTQLETIEITESGVSFDEALQMLQSADYGSLDLLRFVGISDLRFTYGHFEASVNNDNILTSLRANGSVDVTGNDGVVRVIEVRLFVDITDIGTTVVTPPVDLDALDAVLGGMSGMRVRINEDGSLTDMDRWLMDNIEDTSDYLGVGMDEEFVKDTDL